MVSSSKEGGRVKFLELCGDEFNLVLISTDATWFCFLKGRRSEQD